MQDQYETRYGIYNHQAELQPGEARPLASVAMFPSEDYTKRSMLYDVLEEYAENNYKEIWGLNLTQFLALPRFQVEMMREITAEVRKRKTMTMEDIEKQINGGG